MPYLGTTVRLKNTLTDYDGSPLTPDSQEVRIYDPDGTEVDYGDENKFFTPKLESEGVYYLDYIIPVNGKPGKWKAVWKAVIGTTPDEKPNIDVIPFDVSAP